MHPAYEFLNGWAGRIFAVTIPRAAERQARLRDRLAGLDLELVQGMDKRDLDRGALIREGVYDERRARALHRHARPMPLGQIGCAIGHRNAYEEMIRSGCERAVVFEDDVLPRPEALHLLPEALRQLPPGWELCYLGYTRHEVVTPSLRAKQGCYLVLSALHLMKWRPSDVLRLYPKPFSANLRRAGFHHCAHAYVLTLPLAKRLVAANRPIVHNADELLAHLVVRGEISAYVSEPKFFDQDSMVASAEEARAGEPISFIHEGGA
jgi:glycosyl transferase family 25